MKEMKYKEYDCIVQKGTYTDNGNLAILLKDINGYDKIAVATINTDEILESDCAYVKDYSENKGMLEALKGADLIKEVIGVKSIGYTEATLVRFNLEDVEEIN